MKTTMKYTKGCSQRLSNDTLFNDICFDGVKAEEGSNLKVVDCFGPAKTIHKGFCLAKLKK